MHSIRLRGSWELTPDGPRTRHARNFGRPRTLDPAERLWLVCGHVPGAADVLLNGEPAGTAGPGPFAVDVTDRLLVRNTVAFVVASADPLGEVALEVRAASA